MKLILQLSPEKKSVSPENLLSIADNQYTLRPFDTLTLNFFNTLSRFLLSDKKLNRLPAFVALGFWLRRTSMNQIIKENRHLVNPGRHLIEPLGIVFHVCPSNVDTMFFYSLAISLLMGNKNIVKISSRLNNESIFYFTDSINCIIDTDEFKILKKYMTFISYGHDVDISSFFSKIADARILWGGDNTIDFFKSLPSKTRIRDLVFADRISTVVFKSSSFLKLEDHQKREIARKFFNDTYTFDQLGCSSPQLLFSLGTAIDNTRFLNELYQILNNYAGKQYTQDIYSLAILKLNFLTENIIDDRVLNVHHSENYLVFAEIDEKEFNVNKTCGAGFLFVKKIESLDKIKNFITRKIQTLSYFGLTVEELKCIAEISYSLGVDRIVPVGSALNFDYLWDGYNLLEELCNKKRILSA